MKPTRIIETRCTHAQFMAALPAAFGGLPYEIIDNEIIVHDKDRQVRITIHDQPIRHLASLDLPMEKAEFVFDRYSEKQADDFMIHYQQYTGRAGGG